MNTPSTDAPKQQTRLLTAGLCAVLALGVVSVYWPVAGYAFTDYDDQDYVWRNPAVLAGLSWKSFGWAFKSFAAGNWHPLTWLSHMLDVQLYGLHAGGHHVTSLILHTLNTLLVFLWLRRLTHFTGRSFVVAALFGLHPLHVESVAWVAERKDVLSTGFMLLSLMAYTQYVQRFKIQNSKFKIYYVLSLACFAAGLMSKPMVVTLPFVLLLLDYWPLKRIPDSGFWILDWGRLALEKIPFFALSAGSCVATFLAQKSYKAVMALSELPVADRVQNAIISYGAYLQKMIWPEKLTVCYPFYVPVDSDKTITAGFCILILSALVIALRKRQPWLVTGWLWYLGTLVPVIGLVQVGSQSMADRYSYIPLLGIFIAVVWVVSEVASSWTYRRQVLATLSVLVLAGCWSLTAKQVRYWQNSETLAQHGLDLMPDNAAMEELMGNGLMDEGKAEEASHYFAEAVRIWPNNIPVKYDQAKALIRAKQLDEALETCRAALAIDPNAAEIHNMMADIFIQQGKWADAIEADKAVLKTAPHEPLVLNNLAWLLATAPDPNLRSGAEAVRLAEQACQLSNYRVAPFLGTLGAAYAEAGRFPEAIDTAQKAIALAEENKSEVLVRRNRELLNLYQQQKAFHQREAGAAGN